MKHLKKFSESYIKNSDIDGLLIDIRDQGFRYTTQESQIGINLDKLNNKKGFKIKTIYDTIKTLEDLVLANKSRIIYDVYTLDNDDEGNTCMAQETYDTVDSIVDRIDDYISWIDIKIRY